MSRDLQKKVAVKNEEGGRNLDQVDDYMKLERLLNKKLGKSKDLLIQE